MSYNTHSRTDSTTERERIEKIRPVITRAHNPAPFVYRSLKKRVKEPLQILKKMDEMDQSHRSPSPNRSSYIDLTSRIKSIELS